MRAALTFCLLLSLSVAHASEDPDTEVARKHFNAGRSFYDKAEYDKALDEFQAARRVRPHPALDYNIARCLDRLERYQDAINSYESYATSNPPDVAEIRTRIEQLKERLKTVPPKQPPAPKEIVRTERVLVPVEVAAPPKSHKKTVGIVLGVIGGAVAIGVGVAVGLLVKPSAEAASLDSTGGPHQGTQ